MPRSAHRQLHLLCAALFVLATVACSGSSPMAPDGSPTSTGGQPAIIEGTVVPASSASSGMSGDTLGGGSADSTAGLTVRIVGTAHAATVSDAGNFTFASVPPGHVRLQFTSASVNATAELGTVAPSEVIQIQVQISPTSAVIVSQEREGKVSLCHAEGNGSYRMISVAREAEAAHRAHGDGKVGDAVPGRPGNVFNASCEPVGPPVSVTPKVTLCHKTGNGKYVEITVSVDAEPAHRAHGDAKIGEAVPGNAGKVFGTGCSVQ